MKTMIAMVSLLVTTGCATQPLFTQTELDRKFELARGIARDLHGGRAPASGYVSSYRSAPSYIDTTPSRPINYWPQSQSINIRGDRYHCNSFPGLTRTITYCN